ncbi:MAG: amidohydrolase family protein, partial [Kutzneria sp.]|nr:amidohydrolase family protein [Kutzneria sp.]
GSDGSPPGNGGIQHPRLYGTFPRVLGRYVRERQVLDLPTAIHRMTGLSAEIFGVPQRGLVTPGKVADLVCFDPATVDHPGDYLDPVRPPIGIAWVMQSGHMVVDRGRWCGIRRGARLLPV